MQYGRFVHTAFPGPVEIFLVGLVQDSCYSTTIRRRERMVGFETLSRDSTQILHGSRHSLYAVPKRLLVQIDTVGFRGVVIVFASTLLNGLINLSIIVAGV